MQRANGQLSAVQSMHVPSGSPWAVRLLFCIVRVFHAMQRCMAEYMVSPGPAQEQLRTLVNQAQHPLPLCRVHPCMPSRAASGPQGVLHSLSRASLRQTLQG